MMAALSLLSMYLRSSGHVSSQIFLYVVQPVSALGIAAVAYYMLGGASDRIHRRSDKAYMVASVLVVWFVIYFLSGLATTYVHNTLVVTPAGVLLNIFGYGVAAIGIEYTRHAVMQFAGRKNVVWFGVLVTLVFALQQINLTALSADYSAEQFLKFFVADMVPIFAASALLTYLSVSSGLPAMLVYKLGVLAATILLPVLPKYDWYLIGVSSVLLALAVYLVIDRAQQGRRPEHRRHHLHIYRASNIMFIVAMVALVLFMTGALRYKPVVIVSNSMQPVYSRGSMIVVRLKVDPMDIQSGDIIQYKHKQTGQVITHRVLEIQQAGNGSGDRVYITKGDNNQSQDVPVEQSQVMGLVQAQVPYVGYPTVWLRSLIRL